MAQMHDATPYHKRPRSETDRERGCMRKVLAQALKVPRVFDAFGGVGDTARVLREQFPEVALYASDLDAQCCQTYRRRVASPRKVFQGDAGEAFARWATEFEPGQWGASLDFNKFTILDLLQQRPASRWKVRLLERVVARSPAWVELTDSAVRYLHLNWFRYGLAASSPEMYAVRLEEEMARRYGLTLVVWSNHFAAMYLLFKGSTKNGS